MAIPRLYLIESQERDGLVKIGLTGTGGQADEATMVMERIRKYQTGISDPSVIYEISGSPIFEKYLHQFFHCYHKDIPITFQSWNKTFGGPREWFTLQPDIAAALREAFSQKHPTTIEQLIPDDLPVFLSGLFSAIQWEAAQTSPERLLEMARRQEELDSIERYQNQMFLQSDLRVALDEGDFNDADRATEGTQPAQPARDLSPLVDFVQQVFEGREQIARLQLELNQIQESETSRTFIAAVGLVCVIYLWFAGVGLVFFAVCLLILLGSWPYIYPYAVAHTINIWRWLSATAANARQKAG